EAGPAVTRIHGSKSMNEPAVLFGSHDHVFLGAGHEKNERKTWAVIVLCAVMMAVEIVGGSLFGSLALVADGLHMSTHASAMLIAALAYRYARKHAADRRFVFGTGKLGDLAGFTSAVILAMIALLIGYEAVARVVAPVPIHFAEAVPIAVVGLLVNIVSAWLLSGDDHHHGHGHGHGTDESDEHGHGHDDETQLISVKEGQYALSVFEEGMPPVFRIARLDQGVNPGENSVTVTTMRPDGMRQIFHFADRGRYLESTTEIPEPHTFIAWVSISGEEQRVEFEEHGHDHGSGVDSRDHNIRAAYVHVIADAAVSVLAIIGLLLAKAFGWLWMDPLAGIVGALVIANWSYGLMRDTGGILLDICPSNAIEKKVRAAVENAGDKLVDLHIWRLGPGHFGAVISVVTAVAQRNPAFYHSILRGFKGLSHITVEVHPRS
ncbi:MAG TPA: CDF family Co(II)/Ni(II) efflux transporter DmeF, partial [Thermomicrobiales bacterium]|nr:CDF family Co(II)/Ni(II) efflux transporter DmeF [Thermomicrobiales bacterium]